MAIIMTTNSEESTLKQLKKVYKKSKLHKKFAAFKKKHNLLRLSTKLIALSAFVFYLIMLYFLIRWNTKFDNIMQISANYVTIFAFAIGTLQLVAFVNDARQRERRAKKEAALDLARYYAQNIVVKVSFITSVLCRAYDNDNIKKLKEDVIDELIIEKFTSKALKKLQKDHEFKRFSNFLKNDAYNIPADILLNQFECYGYTDIPNKGTKKDVEYQRILNLKFRGIVSQTLNELEYFSMSVNQNISDSEMLFPSLHQTFLRIIKHSYPIICQSNDAGREEYYTNVIKLYKKWNKRLLEHKDLIMNQNEESEHEIEKDLHKGNKPI
ncbi:MAG: hypothetical protein E7533_07785 [Ruminococcaceae bacterium]|nr:hypothetical protein [Oscillospiraceae bacterium]